MTDTLRIRLDDLVIKEDFQKAAMAVNSIEEFFDLLHDNEIDLSEEDMAYCVESAEMVMKERGLMTEDGELSEEMLEAVAGGGAFLDSMAGIIGGGIWIGLGIAYKTCGAAAICATIGTGCCVIGGVLVLAGVAIGAAAIYKKYKKKK